MFHLRNVCATPPLHAHASTLPDHARPSRPISVALGCRRLACATHLSCHPRKQKPIVAPGQTDGFDIAPCNREQIKSLHHRLQPLLLYAINCLHQLQPFRSLKRGSGRKTRASDRVAIAVSVALFPVSGSGSCSLF